MNIFCLEAGPKTKLNLASAEELPYM